ncbi:MAG: 50S ribosomal protein L5 [Deltaproteobacteria bacterium]|nr:50S ribosomal protein L5 [Deltaproteobacteria bacterium]MBI3017094.1 50S ribosomal protein L5 [Deltaproteobacteria bacterium]
MARLKKQFEKEGIPKLKEQLKLKNAMQVPCLKKITVSICLSEAVQNSKVLDKAAADLAVITGQKAKMTRAKKSIANFKLRAGQPLGVVVTLRKDRMYEFLDRLINVAFPRVRDFRGIPPKAFDGRGNYSLGVKEQIIFPEINYDTIDKVRGMNINIETSAKTDEQGKALLQYLGMPFRT